ncbi:glycoside hydrolase family 2 TIM barrel-domain containing protein [Novosphingobium gossypii]|uniref:glycoside hydrolase family 2 TIM barrel-domain containing protein n=1 Tax=Novosphingobium gossypii TaxID=1604774 RepID=UPI003D2049D2
MGIKGVMIVKAWRMLPTLWSAARTMAWVVGIGAFSSLTLAADPALVPQTEKLMLSGTGPDDAVPWDFHIDGGQKAGENARISVPSNWQQQGFGHYQYGYDKGPRAADHGSYRRSFTVPAAWKGRTIRIVFDAVMTDALVKVNGTQAGPLHQGGFNRFSYDVTALVKPGEPNTVEVEVSEASAATDTDVAERRGDYWVFGGIYRPVWLEAAPAQSIAQVSIDARASGAIVADVALAAPRTVTQVVAQVRDGAGRSVGAPFAGVLPAGGEGRVRLQGQVVDPALWSAETPSLYTLDVMLLEGDRPVHKVTRRFGFRTFEVRDGQGLFLNGRRIFLKGVNRHSFTPETGRAISRAQAYKDVRDIRALNMNAVRMSHYSPEEAFLEAADEIGLYVIDELSGWQHAHDTDVGRKLVRELVERDVNHPSILFWTNGNEGGWNRELDGDFALYDPQQRRVLHPWEEFGGIDTKHYPRYPDLQRRLAGKALVMPTEFLHGLYDGGGGSGLDDYWKAITQSPRGAGGFLWNYADEGIARTDQGGRIDTYAAYAPDGIIGPHGEKEPSWWTVKDVWSPVQIAAPRLDDRFDGSLAIRNLHDFTTLDAVKFRWEWVKFPRPDARTTAATILAAGELSGPPVAPQGEGKISLPLAPDRADADALRLTARRGAETLWTWVWPTQRPVALPTSRTLGQPKVEADVQAIRLKVGTVSASFDPATGLLTQLRHGARAETFDAGPRLVLARPKGKADSAWIAAAAREGGIYELATPVFADVASVDLGTAIEDGWGGFALDVSADGQRWERVYEGARTSKDGQDYAFTPRMIRALRISGLKGVRATPQVRSVRVAGSPERYASPALGAVTVTTGSGRDPETGRPVAWVESRNAAGLESARWTLREDGRLTLDYRYTLSGPYLYHGIGFSGRDLGIASARALVRGPSPVWQNRLRGTEPGVYDIAAKGDGALPDTAVAGYFADPRWVRLTTAAGPLTVASEGARFLQLGARLADFPTTTVAFPTADFGFMAAIPAMGAKGQAAELTGPAGEPATAEGAYSGRLTFSF